LGKAAAGKVDRAMAMLSAAVHELEIGLYSSAELRSPEVLLAPPATSTSPPASRVAVGTARPVDMFPADDQELVVGLYSSAEVRYTPA
jgi:hypothetical protein